MPVRNRTTSPNMALLSGPAPATGVHGTNLNQVWALTSLSWDASIDKQDILIYGQTTPLGREATDSPQSSLSYSYYVTSTYNEVYSLGFNLNGTSSMLAPLLAGGDDRNYFVFIAPDGSDAQQCNGATSNIRIHGLGNMFLNSYSLEASVGGFPTASVQLQGLNLKSYTNGVSQQIPAVNPTNGVEISTGTTTFTIPTISKLSTGNPTTIAKTVLKQGDISVNLSAAGAPFMDYTNTCVQSVNLSFDLNRTPINCLGSKFATSREIQFPINVNFEVEMLAKDVLTGSLANYFCDTGVYSAEVTMRLPSCGSSTGNLALGYKLLNLTWQSSEFVTNLGSDPATVRTRWLGQIGASGDTSNNMYMSGSFS